MSLKKYVTIPVGADSVTYRYDAESNLWEGNMFGNLSQMTNAEFYAYVRKLESQGVEIKDFDKSYLDVVAPILIELSPHLGK